MRKKLIEAALPLDVVDKATADEQGLPDPDSEVGGFRAASESFARARKHGAVSTA